MPTLPLGHVTWEANPPPPDAGQTPPPPRGRTNACQNMTLPQTSFAER